MTDPHAALQNLLQPTSLSQTLFPPTSRYAGLELAAVTQPGGTAVAYVRRRFIPRPESYAPLAEHTVTQGERLDIIAARYLGDPELFWRICDANAALDPDALIGPENEGRVIVVGVPEA